MRRTNSEFEVLTTKMAVFRELTDSLRNNKLRTFLTGFTAAWGIIILVVMMGAGQGIENGLRATMESFWW